MERMNRLHWHCTSGKWRVSFKFNFFPFFTTEIVRFKNLGTKLLPNFFIYFIVDSKSFFFFFLHLKAWFSRKYRRCQIETTILPSKSNFHSRTTFESFYRWDRTNRGFDLWWSNYAMEKARKRNRWREAKHNHWRERIEERKGWIEKQGRKGTAFTCARHPMMHSCCWHAGTSGSHDLSSTPIIRKATPNLGQ